MVIFDTLPIELLAREGIARAWGPALQKYGYIQRTVTRRVYFKGTPAEERAHWLRQLRRRDQRVLAVETEDFIHYMAELSLSGVPVLLRAEGDYEEGLRLDVVFGDGVQPDASSIVARFLAELLVRYQAEPTATAIRARFDKQVYVMVRRGPSLGFVPLAAMPTALQRTNYSEEVLRGYDKVAAELASPTPSGRLAIFNGPPGTGKTYLLRGLINQTADAMFVLVPSGMTEALASPELLPLLMDFQAVVPIVLVIEDADALLAKRVAANMTALSTLLNLGDGILGGVLDLRVLVTTNTEPEAFDPAMLRPGRLIANVEVGPLRGADVPRIGKSLVPSKTDWPSEATLADVYAMARAAGWVPKPRTFDVAPQAYRASLRPARRVDSVESLQPPDDDRTLSE